MAPAQPSKKHPVPKYASLEELSEAAEVSTPEGERLWSEDWTDADKPWVCVVPGCDTIIRTNRKCDRVRHMKIHLRERPLQCKFPGCWYTAVQPSNMKTHELKHGAIKESCTHEADDGKPCPFRYTDPSAFTRHRQDKHRWPKSHTRDRIPSAKKTANVPQVANEGASAGSSSAEEVPEVSDANTKPPSTEDTSQVSHTTQRMTRSKAKLRHESPITTVTPRQNECGRTASNEEEKKGKLATPDPSVLPEAEDSNDEGRNIPLPHEGRSESVSHDTFSHTGAEELRLKYPIDVPWSQGEDFYDHAEDDRSARTSYTGSPAAPQRTGAMFSSTLSHIPPRLRKESFLSSNDEPVTPTSPKTPRLVSIVRTQEYWANCNARPRSPAAPSFNSSSGMPSGSPLCVYEGHYPRSVPSIMSPAFMPRSPSMPPPLLTAADWDD